MFADCLACAARAMLEDMKLKWFAAALLVAVSCAAQTRPASVRFKIDPEYTKQARKAKLQGLVGLALVVDTQGNPTEVRIVRSLGMGLDEKAVEAVGKWLFNPAMNDGHPVKYSATIDVSFKLLRNPPMRVRIENQ